MKLLTSVCVLIASLTIVCMAVGQENNESKKELEKMQGVWRVVSWQMADEKKAGDEVKKMKVTVKGNTLIDDSDEERKKKGEGSSEGTIKLDPKTKAFDWNLTDLGVNMLAIYELKGDDLKIGFGNDGLIRPKRMEMGKEDVVWLLVLKRAKR